MCLDFLIPISIRPYLTHICRTVFLPCSDRVAMDRSKSDFSKSRHSTCNKQSCTYEVKFGDVCVCVCVCVCGWSVGYTGVIKLPSQVEYISRKYSYFHKRLLY